MTKEQAIEAMKAGKKLTHRYFNTHEWVTSTPDGLEYTFEDGHHALPVLFWYDRQAPGWNDGWEEYIESKI